MSGFKNFFRKNTNALRNEPGNKNTNRRHSSCLDGEDLYEAVDPEQEDNSSTFSPEAETSVWSENEFDDEEEDIYLNDSELAPAKTGDIEVPSLPPLPPRTRGPTQNNYPTVVLPSTNQQNHQQSPPVPDSKRFKQQVRKEDSVDSTESYEEFNETSARDMSKIGTIKKPTTVNEEEEDSDSEDYEAIDSPIDRQKSAHKFNNENVLPLGTKVKSLEATPALMPSLPPRSNRPCPPVPQEISEEIYESVESEPSAPSKPEPAIFSKLASAFRAKNLTKQSNKPEVIKPTPISPDTYDIEDSPPLSHKNQQFFTRKLPEIPVIGDAILIDEVYETADEPPAIPNFSSDRKLSEATFDCLKSRKLPPTPDQMGIPDETIKAPPRVSPTPRKNLPAPPPPDSESEEGCELDGDTPSQPPSVSQKPTTTIKTAKPPNNIQKEIPKPVKEDSQLKIKQRTVPYTHVMPKNKDEDSESSLPLPFGRKPLKSNESEINKPAPENKQTSFSKSPSFLQKQMTAKNIHSANNSAEDVEAERTAEKEINKPVKNNYWKHTPQKIQVQISPSADTISSEKPVKTNYPRHVPPKPLSKKVAQNQDDITSANEENSILADAMNKLKGFKVTTAKVEQDDSRTGERKFNGLPLKQTNQGSASRADVSPYHKEQRCKDIPSVSDSRSHKDHGKKTSLSNEKVLAKSDVKSHISDLMNKLEKTGSFTKVGSPNSGAVNKPEHKSSPVVDKNNNPPGKDSSLEKTIREKGFKDVKGPENPVQTWRNKYHSEEKLPKEEPIKQKSVEETKTNERNLKHSNTLPKQVVPSRSPIVPVKQKTVTPKDSLEDCSWYLPDVSRPDAEKKLRSIGKDGAFLVRNSQRGASLTPYSLSLLHSDRIYNLQIRKRSDNKYAIGSEKAEEQSFGDLVEMVNYHATIPIEIMGVGSKVYLLHPAQK